MPQLPADARRPQAGRSRVTSLQLGLIAAGTALVVGVVVYNWLQMRLLRRRLKGDRRASAEAPARRRNSPATADTPDGDRVEPTISQGHAPDSPDEEFPEASPGVDEDADTAYEPPLAIHARIASGFAADGGASAGIAAHALSPDRNSPQPDADVECVLAVECVAPIPAGALAAGLHARPGKPLRWFGRRDEAAPWHLITSDTPGEFQEFAACMLLADRGGAATPEMLAGFVTLVRELAATHGATVDAPDAADEAARADALDRICAELDVQIGLTLHKHEPATIAGTRLRGVAEAAGFRLNDAGRFEWIQDDTGAVLYSLQNARTEPLTRDALRVMSIGGIVFLLDVPRVAEPARAFDQMKLAARRMAQTLDMALVDDNRRPLDDAALAAIRKQVDAAASALRDVHIEPGSARALALFGG
jgi:hypothetical protein